MNFPEIYAQNPIFTTGHTFRENWAYIYIYTYTFHLERTGHIYIYTYIYTCNFFFNTKYLIKYHQ